MYWLQEIILQHGRNSPYKGEINNPSLRINAENSFCGDILKLDLRICKNTITDIAFSGEGCLISQAATSLLIEKIKRIQEIDKIKKINKKTMLDLLGIPLTPSRIKCALLSLEALQKSLISK